MLAEIVSILSGAKTASELISRGLVVVKNKEGREELLEINRFVAALEAEARGVDAKYAELLESKEAIEKELIEYKSWDAKAAKYERKEISLGWTVMALKEAQPSSQRAPYFCPKCFQNEKESILQGIDVEAVHYECTAKCGFETPRTFPAPPAQPKVNLPRFRRSNR